MLAIVTSITQGPSTVAGNPSWFLALDTGETVRTLADASVGYDIHDGMIGRPARIAMCRWRGSWRVIGIRSFRPGESWTWSEYPQGPTGPIAGQES